jgi:hypothetical protein
MEEAYQILERSFFFFKEIEPQLLQINLDTLSILTRIRDSIVN